MPNRHTLERLSEEYRTNVPDDLREPRSFNWYLDALYEEPRIARNAHQRVADMFDHYGTQYDEERGVVEYALAADDPPTTARTSSTAERSTRRSTSSSTR